MGRAGGKAVFVPFSAAGDVLDVEIVKRHKNYDVARILNIKKPSRFRVEPRCKYFGRCGGCHLQHISYTSQLLWKQMILEEQLLRIGGLVDPGVLPSIESPLEWGYRNRIQVHKGKGGIGFFAMGSNDIVDVERCLVAEDGVNLLLSDARKKWPKGNDRIEISTSDESSFLQVNSCVNEILKCVLADWVGSVGRTLELYAGSGNLTFALARISSAVVAVEAEEVAATNGIRTASEAGVKNVEFVHSTVEDYIKERRIGRFELVVADPPRRGIEKSAIRTITELKPRRIIYISCNPATLARDVKIFASYGYNLIKSQPIDMFPQTYHIESISLLT